MYRLSQPLVKTPLFACSKPGSQVLAHPISHTCKALNHQLLWWSPAAHLDTILYPLLPGFLGLILLHSRIPLYCPLPLHWVWFSVLVGE